MLRDCGVGSGGARPLAYLLAILTTLLFAVIPAIAAPQSQPPQLTEIDLYVSKGCQHCAASQEFFARLAQERHDFRITLHDIQRDPHALIQLDKLSRAHGLVRPGVPTIRIGQALIVGFDRPETTGTRIRQTLDRVASPTPTIAESQCGIESDATCDSAPDDTIRIPLLDLRVSAESLGLPLFTIVVGLLDGFNPCSMWVLILMISMLASLGDRRKMLVIAGTFVAIEGIAYFAFMAAWLNLFLVIGLSRVSLLAIGCIALVAGIINLKDFVMPGHGISLSIPAIAKPAIYAKLRNILTADSLWPAVLGTVVLAVLVQIVELLCTSGFPALYTRILTLRQFDKATYYAYLLLYNAMYMLDDVVVLGIGVVTLSQRRLQEKEGRLLKLIAGLTMFCLGIYLLSL